MSTIKRLIPTLQILDKRLVKTIKFSADKYLGDPLNAIKIFNLKEVSELIVTDIGATQNNQIDFVYLEKLVGNAFIPLTYGGGVQNLLQVDKLFQIGFDKVLFGTACYTNHDVISATAEKYGSQSIICSIDINKGLLGCKITYRGNKNKFYDSRIENVIQRCIKLGAGEIMLHDVKRDGTYLGIDHDFMINFVKKYNVPMMICGGAKNLEDMNHAFSYGASSVAAGSIFNFFGKHKAVLINYEVGR